jgi:hypothetical protein
MARYNFKDGSNMATLALRRAHDLAMVRLNFSNWWKAGLGVAILALDWLARLEFVYDHAKKIQTIQPALDLVLRHQSIVIVIAIVLIYWDILGREARLRGELATGPGGKGGKAKVVGRKSGAEGGSGGEGGAGPGGEGGDAEVTGDNSFARGGDGGNAGQWDGRGGRRTMSPGERLNLPTATWRYGYGGAGANAPEYDRRLNVLTTLRQEYFETFKDDARFIHAGIDQVPVRWINKRLEELGEAWRVELRDGGYVLPPLGR